MKKGHSSKQTCGQYRYQMKHKRDILRILIYIEVTLCLFGFEYQKGNKPATPANPAHNFVNIDPDDERPTATYCFSYLEKKSQLGQRLVCIIIHSSVISYYKYFRNRVLRGGHYNYRSI